MKREIRLKRIEAKIERIKAALSEVGEMRPGSISKQYNVCGNPNCRCKDKRKPKKHGPYYQLSYVHQGRNSSQFIRKEFLSRIRQQVRSYRKFRKLTDEWVSLALEHAKLTLEVERES
jgi:hypothetical protein